MSEVLDEGGIDKADDDFDPADYFNEDSEDDEPML